LHHLVETRLEAPALAWSYLAYYWGMSAFGLGPAYKDYMQSDQPQQDKAFNAPSNEDLNKISGFDRRPTIQERFNRAANFYVYCYQQGAHTAINPPFDMPPILADLVATRLRSEPKAAPPDEFIQASFNSLLNDRPELQELWAQGQHEQRAQRAQAYNTRVLETLQYVMSEIDSFFTVTTDQLSDTGFLAEGTTGERFNVTADLMDEVMPEEVQDRKFGECRILSLPTGKELVRSGIFGAYYTMGHNIELAMFDEESKSRLSSTHHAILHTWRQLYDINKEENT
jgi:hypothetical protein